MVAKISFGSSLYGALAYNGEKINKEEGKLLATNKIFDDCSGNPVLCGASSLVLVGTIWMRYPLL